MGKTRGEDLPSCDVLCIYRGTYGIIQIYINNIIIRIGETRFVRFVVLRRVKKTKKKDSNS